jgi:hypothetical protein
MPIAPGELRRDFILVGEEDAVRQVRDQVVTTGSNWTYVVVRLENGQYAVFWLAELVQVLQSQGEGLLPEMLDAPLRYVPGLLAPRAGNAVEQASMSTSQAIALCRKMPGRRLVVLAGGDVVGLLAAESRSAQSAVDLKWLDQPVDRETHPAIKPDTPTAKGGPGAPGREESRPEMSSLPDTGLEAETRWINAEIQDHTSTEPLQIGEVYTLAFDVDTRLRDAALGGARFDYHFEADEQSAELTVQLASDDFKVYTGPQKLIVPRTGKSKNKARFDIEPKHDGEGVINAVFLKDGNFIQLLTLKLHVGVYDQGDALKAEALGRPVDAAFVVQPRDLNLTILNTGVGFQLIMSGAVGAMATLPLTLAELDRIIADVREDLRSIVRATVGPQKTRSYQTGIDIPSHVNSAALQRLARAGFRLYQRIFYGPAADSQVRLVGDKLREMARKETLKIQVFSQQFMLPWGVLYVADEYDPERVEPELFLGLKHIIEHIPLQQTMQVTDGKVTSRPRMTVSLNLNADIDQEMGMPLIAGQLQDWEGISQTSGVQVIVRRTRDEVTAALGNSTTPDQVLYFYCHAISRFVGEAGGPDQSSLVLSGKGYLTLEDLNLVAPSTKGLPGAPLVFINACESAELSPLFYDGFVPYFMAKGARGVIGTECETPALFAAEWAKRFFHHFLTGKPLGQAFLDLRREFYYQHNNVLGLLYALYCDGDTQVVPGLPL